jgi:rhodanese-related sulfurtransferase
MMLDGAVDRDEVRRLVAAGAQLVEVLPREDFDEEHLPGAVNIPLAELGDRLHELDRSRPVVVYCFDAT